MIVKQLVAFIILVLTLSSSAVLSKDLPKPEIMLAKVYQQGLELRDYWVSEKYDGVRALWDGKQLISRGGNIYHAPDWFISGFPKQRLDGELWIARQNFELLVSTVRDKTPNQEAWKKVKFMVFDLPDVDEVFDKRLIQLNKLIQSSHIPWLTAVKQIKLKDHQALMRKLDFITKQGAEGLMLHKGSSYYRAKRSGDLLKVKKYEDAEAMVVGHIAGKGKYKNSLGALLVVLDNGERFKIGSGFTDLERANPPAIGSVITYQFFGKTKKGIPRFASFLRERIDKED